MWQAAAVWTKAHFTELRKSQNTFVWGKVLISFVGVLVTITFTTVSDVCFGLSDIWFEIYLPTLMSLWKLFGFGQLNLWKLCSQWHWYHCKTEMFPINIAKMYHKVWTVVTSDKGDTCKLMCSLCTISFTMQTIRCMPTGQCMWLHLPVCV